MFTILFLQLKVHTKLVNGQDFDLDIDLCHPITPDQTVSKVLGSKVIQCLHSNLDTFL